MTELASLQDGRAPVPRVVSLREALRV